MSGVIPPLLPHAFVTPVGIIVPFLRESEGKIPLEDVGR